MFGSVMERSKDRELESRLLKTVLKLDEIDKNIYRLTNLCFGFSVVNH